MELIDLSQLNLQWIVQAVSMAAVYSFVFYAKEHIGNDEEIDWGKLGRTMLLGISIGIFTVLTGGAGVIGPNQALGQQLAAYLGLIAFTEALLKTAYRWISDRYPVQEFTPQSRPQPAGEDNLDEPVIGDAVESTDER